MRTWVRSPASLSGLRIQGLLWLWCRMAATAQIPPLAWELPYAVGVALKSKQRNQSHRPHVTSYIKKCSQHPRSLGHCKGLGRLVPGIGDKDQAYFLSYPLPCPFLKTNSSRETNRTTADPGDIQDNPQLLFYQLVYGLNALLMVFMGILSSVSFTKVMGKASTVLHNELFNKVRAWALGMATG